MRRKLDNFNIIESQNIKESESFTLNYLLVSNTYFGLFMKRNFGRKSMKKTLTHGCITCVWGDLKWTFNTTTVTHILFKEKGLKYSWKEKSLHIFLPYRYQYHSKYKIFAKQGHNQTVASQQMNSNNSSDKNVV